MNEDLRAIHEERYEALNLAKAESDGLVETLEMLEQEEQYTNALFVIKQSVIHLGEVIQETPDAMDAAKKTKVY